MEQGKPNSLLRERRDESDFIYRLVGNDSVKSKCLVVMTRIGLSNLHWKVADLHMGVALKFWRGSRVKPNEVAVVTFKSIPILEELIIPFFLKYPLLSAKSYEFEKWCDIVKLLRTQNHIGKTLTARDTFLEIANLCSD